MDPISAGLMGGLSAVAGLGTASIQNQWNAEAVDKQQDFQEMMSNTAYTRATADMKNAGLNPAMMYGSGGPASVPSGASIAAPNIPNPVATGTDTAIGLMKNKQQQDLTDAQVENTDADTTIKSKTSDLLDRNISNAEMDFANKNAQNRNQNQLNDLQDMANEVYRATRPDKIKTSHTEADWAKTNQWLNAINSVSGSAHKLKSTIGD